MDKIGYLPYLRYPLYLPYLRYSPMEKNIKIYLPYLRYPLYSPYIVHTIHRTIYKLF